MLTVPSDLQLKFDEYLRKSVTPVNVHGAYKKWLRYYLDYCQKYQKPPEQEKSLPLFIAKLQEKRQTADQIKQACASVEMYYDILKKTGGDFRATVPAAVGPAKNIALNHPAAPNRSIAQAEGDDHVSYGNRQAAPPANVTVRDPQAHYGFPAKTPIGPPNAASCRRHAKPETGVSWTAEYSRLGT